MEPSEVLRKLAERDFKPGGDAEMLVDEIVDGEEFCAGRRRGHEDAYHVLIGTALHFETMGVV